MHIPGPWKLNKISGGNWTIEAELKHPKGKSIAQIFEVPITPTIEYANLKDGEITIQLAYSAWYQFEIGDWNEKTWEANANLIAAAPNLYQAVLCALADLEGLRNEGFFDYDEGDPEPPQIKTIEELQEAIAIVKNETTS